MRFLQEKAELRDLGKGGFKFDRPQRWSPRWDRYSDRAEHHPPELHLPSEDGVGPTAWMQPQKVSIPVDQSRAGKRTKGRE